MVHDTNGDGKPDEILIMDSEDLTLATKVWRWNKEGLGYAYNATGNAYLGPYGIAMTADGKINASFITTGLLNAELIRIGDEKFGDYIRLENGVMHFGSADNDMSLRLGNITAGGTTTQQVALYSGETRIAYFSNNSFEIENLQEGKIRFQNFGFITRASGNLSFTKLV
jgi:phage-related protein